MNSNGSFKSIKGFNKVLNLIKYMLRFSKKKQNFARNSDNNNVTDYKSILKFKEISDFNGKEKLSKGVQLLTRIWNLIIWVLLRQTSTISMMHFKISKPIPLPTFGRHTCPCSVSVSVFKTLLYYFPHIVW
ncbi:CIC_collapsed_G0024420.mRNA.1.CDS.1 [Saccharomyces cerevisiae]|nr:CIC_collapsed_G0024420.mRNA.1.CDS.1 [Saccharomyces cerevisiae]